MNTTWIEDAVGLVILAAIAISILATTGFAALISIELLSGAASWAGIGPAQGWAIIGCISGAAAGSFKALKAHGRSDDLRKAWVAGGIIVSMVAIAGVFSPAGHALFDW